MWNSSRKVDFIYRFIGYDLKSYVFIFLTNWPTCLKHESIEGTCTYKRFNVGQYMKENRLGWLEIQNKNKKVNATRKKLERMDKKVENVSLFYLLEMLIFC